MKKAIENFEESCINLNNNKRFYASLILGCRKYFTNEVPTMGVNVTNTVNLYINPFFFNSLTKKERMALLLHEMGHVLGNHFKRFEELNENNLSLLNQAADFAINEYIPDLPKTFNVFNSNGDIIKQGLSPCLVENLKENIPDVKNKQHMEYYYEILKQNKTNNMKTIDDHSLWKKGNASQEQITEVVKKLVNSAVEECGMGDLPNEIRQSIEILNYSHKNWRQDIQIFAANTSEIITETSRKKRNRRYGIQYPGNITYSKLHLAIGIDSSGSVYDEQLRQFFTEILRLYNMNISLTIIECDTQVNDVYSFNPKKPFTIKGRGGTSFKPVFDKCAKLDIDGLIYFTDLQCNDEGVIKPKYPVLWAGVGNKNVKPPYNWGHRTFIDIKRKVT